MSIIGQLSHTDSRAVRSELLFLSRSSFSVKKDSPKDSELRLCTAHHHQNGHAMTMLTCACPAILARIGSGEQSMLAMAVTRTVI